MDFFDVVRKALQVFVIDSDMIDSEWSWLQALFATVFDWFATLFD